MTAFFFFFPYDGYFCRCSLFLFCELTWSVLGAWKVWEQSRDGVEVWQRHGNGRREKRRKCFSMKCAYLKLESFMDLNSGHLTFSHCTPPMGLTHMSWVGEAQELQRSTWFSLWELLDTSADHLPCDRARHCNPAESSLGVVGCLLGSGAKMVLKGTGKKKLVMRRVCSFPLACYVKVMGRQQPVQRSHA